MAETWVVPLAWGDEAAEAIRNIVATRFAGHHCVFLHLSSNYTEACTRRDAVDAHMCHASSDCTKLFKQMQKHRARTALGSRSRMVIVVDPLDRPIVSPAYNRLFKDCRLGIIVVSTLPCIVKDHRLLRTYKPFIAMAAAGEAEKECPPSPAAATGAATAAATGGAAATTEEEAAATWSGWFPW